MTSPRYPARCLSPDVLFTLVIVLYLLSAVSGAKVSSPASMSVLASNTSSSAPDGTCVGFNGDNNTYGLGIRLGAYLQWISSAFAYTFVQEEVDTMRGVNLYFTLSNFIGMYLTFRR